MKNVIIAILVALLIVAGFMIGAKKKANVAYEPWPETEPANPTTPKPKPTTPTPTQPEDQVSNSDVRQGWQAISSSVLLNLATAQGIGLESGSAVQLSEMIDITGDGLDEGIFTGNGGNSGMTFIMTRDSSGNNVIAKQKDRNGMIGPVQLLSVGRAMVSESYKIVASIKGYYTVSKSNDGESGNFECNVNGLNAYSWNSSTKLFEWNSGYTTTYTAEVCN